MIVYKFQKRKTIKLHYKHKVKMKKEYKRKYHFRTKELKWHNLENEHLHHRQLKLQ